MENQNLNKIVKLSNNETIAFSEYGSYKNQALIMLHGNYNNKDSFLYYIARLKNTFKIYALDLRGFGDSSYLNPITSIYDFTEDIKLFIESLKIKSPIIIGFSLGGGVALALKLLYPSLCSKIILLAPVSISGIPVYTVNKFNKRVRCKTKEELITHPYSRMLEDFISKKDKNAIRAYLYNSFKGSEELSKNGEEERKKYEKAMETIVNSWLKVRNLNDVMMALVSMNFTNDDSAGFKGDGNIKKLKEKILIIHGDNDKVVPVTCSLQTKKILGDLCLLSVLKNWGHNLLFHEDNSIYKLVTDFLKSEIIEPQTKF